MSSPTILISHSDNTLVTLISNIAGNINYQCHIISISSYFYTEYKTLKPDLILHDFFMESLDGIELVRWLIEQGNRAGVILATGKKLELTKAASVLAARANLFPVTILPIPASRSDIQSALEP